MAAFPAYGRLSGKYGEKPTSAVLRTEMESGPAKQAKIHSRSMVTRAVTMIFTSTEYTSFMTWFRDSISRGADWFDWTDPIDDTLKQARIVKGELEADSFSKSEGDLLSWEVKFLLETWDS